MLMKRTEFSHQNITNMHYGYSRKSRKNRNEIEVTGHGIIL